MDIVMEDLKLRIEAVRDAIKRSRLTLLVSNVASASILLAAWNAYFSWYRYFAMRQSFDTNEVTGEAQKELVREWVDSHVISISLLGIRIGVSDLAFVGSIALFIVVAWFFYAARKENHLIGVLLRDTQKGNADLRRLVYHGVSAYLVFVTITRDDRPISSLAPDSVQKPIFFLRPTMKLLFFLPALLTLFLVLMDFLTVWCLPAAFRYPHSPLRGQLTHSEWLQFWFMDGIAVAMFLLTYVLSKRTSEFGDATRNLLREYGTLDRAEAPPPESAEAAPVLPS